MLFRALLCFISWKSNKAIFRHFFHSYFWNLFKIAPLGRKDRPSISSVDSNTIFNRFVFKFPTVLWLQRKQKYSAEIQLLFISAFWKIWSHTNLYLYPDIHQKLIPNFLYKCRGIEYSLRLQLTTVMQTYIILQ